MNILDLTLPSPAENLALDEALLDAAESGESGEVLRFWESPTHFVVVGYANKVATEVNLPACEAQKIPILRRCSGGGTVLQGPGCLNYALVLRIADDKPTHSIHSANQFIMERNRAALDAEIRNPQSAIRIEGHTDLALGTLKFSGNSQRRKRNYLLFHGTFLLNFDVAQISVALRPPSHEPNYRARRSHAEFLTCLNLPAPKVKAALQRCWKAESLLLAVPLERTLALVRERYGQPDWNRRF